MEFKHPFPIIIGILYTDEGRKNPMKTFDALFRYVQDEYHGRFSAIGHSLVYSGDAFVDLQDESTAQQLCSDIEQHVPHVSAARILDTAASYLSKTPIARAGEAALEEKITKGEPAAPKGWWQHIVSGEAFDFYVRSK